MQQPFFLGFLTYMFNYRTSVNSRHGAKYICKDLSTSTNTNVSTDGLMKKKFLVVLAA